VIRQRGESVEVRSSAEISPDPTDDAFYLCAETGKANVLFTFNPKNHRHRASGLNLVVAAIRSRVRLR